MEPVGSKASVPVAIEDPYLLFFCDYCNRSWPSIGWPFYRPDNSNLCVITTWMLSIPRARENKATSDGQRKKLDFCFLLKKKKYFFCCSRRNARRPWRRRPVPVASWSMLPIIWSGVVTILTFVHFQPDYPHVLAKRRSRRDTFFPPFFRIMAAAAAGLFKTCLSPESGSSFVCLYSPSHLVVRSFWYNPVPHTL